MLIAMTENKKTGKENKGKKNKNIKMNGVVITELLHGKIKYMLVKVIIPSNDHHFAIVVNDNYIMTVKAVGVYVEDAFNYAIQKAKERGDDDEIDRLYLLLGKFSLRRWNGEN